MKFRNYLENINGIGVYPMIALIIFFSIFVGIGLYVAFADKKTMDEMGSIPFDEQ